MQQRIQMRIVVVAGLLCAASCMLFARSASAASASQRQLNAVLPEVRFDGVALSDAVDFLRDVTGANIDVNWKALEAAGVSRDTSLNIRLRAVSLRKALGLVLSQAGAGNALGFTLDEGVIEITTQEQIDSIMYTRVYPVEDLLMEIPDFSGPDISLNPTSNTPGQNGTQSGGSSTSATPLLPMTPGINDEKVKTRAERAAELVQLIQDLIPSPAWVDNGGRAVIRFYNGNLVVTAPRSVQEAIGGAFD